jgi:hypothetical protein
MRLWDKLPADAVQRRAQTALARTLGLRTAWRANSESGKLQAARMQGLVVPCAPVGCAICKTNISTNGTYPLFYARYVQVVGHGAALAICQVSVYKVAVPAPGNGIIYIQALPGNLVAVYGLVSSVYQTTIYNVTSNTHAAIQAASGVRLSAISSGSDGSVYISGTSAATGAVLLQVNLTNFAVTSTNLAGFQMPLASFAAF